MPASDDAPPMHGLTPDNERLLHTIAELALDRRRRTPPLNAPRPAAELLPPLAAAICPDGLGGDAALALFRERIVPTAISNDHPDFLAFVPHAPTEAAIGADWLLGAFPSFTGAWNDGAGLIAAENAVLQWLAGLAGLPPGAGGCFVPGATLGTLSALHAARHAARLARPDAGTGARSDEQQPDPRSPPRMPPSPTRWAVLASREAHASVAAAARVLDVDLIELDTGDHFRLDGATVRAALDDDRRRAERRVFAVVASAGTTNLGVVDDLPGIGAACREAGVWLHVDAAYGGAALLSDRARPLLAGIGAADSLVVDPHKWLFAPYDSCALLYRDPPGAAQALAQRAEYIDPIHAGNDWNPFNYGIHLSRRARGFPLWFSLATYGTRAYAGAIDASFELAQAVAADICSRPSLELAMDPALTVIAFHRRGWDAAAHERWSHDTLRDGRAFIAPTSVRGRPALRLCLLNPRARLARIAAILDTLG